MKSVFCIYQFFFSLTDDVHSLFHLQHCLQSNKKSLCQPFSIPMLIIVYYIIIQWLNYYIQYYKNVFAHKRYYYAYDSNATNTFFFSVSSLLESTTVLSDKLATKLRQTNTTIFVMYMYTIIMYDVC